MVSDFWALLYIHLIQYHRKYLDSVFFIAQINYTLFLYIVSVKIC